MGNMENLNAKELNNLISSSFSRIEVLLQAHRESVRKTGFVNYIVDLRGSFLICVFLSAFGVISLNMEQTISFSIIGSILMILGVQMHLARFKAETEGYDQEVAYHRERLEELERKKPKI